MAVTRQQRKKKPKFRSSIKTPIYASHCWEYADKSPKPSTQAAVQAAGDLSSRQYGFKKGRSTNDAVQEVARAAQEEQRGSRCTHKIVLLVPLDVKNAFSSARWADILHAHEQIFGAPQ